MRILILGLDNAGKTTILYRLHQVFFSVRLFVCPSFFLSTKTLILSLSLFNVSLDLALFVPLLLFSPVFSALLVTLSIGLFAYLRL